MEQLLENISQNSEFNKEVIWDNKKNLFKIYFKNKFFHNRFRLSLYELEEDLDFSHALNILNSI